jgi:hypothetical protein
VPSRLVPIATERFALHVSFGRSAYDKLRYAQSLLGHQVPSGDLSEVLERVLDLAIGQLEKRKLGATHRPRPVRRFSQNARYIPRHVRRAVWERDGGRCTFVSSTGHRCEARTRLEFDHVDPVARGGQATMAGVRLRCRSHNQYGAECAFGADFMRDKREQSRAARTKSRAPREESPEREESRARGTSREAEEPRPVYDRKGGLADGVPDGLADRPSP